MALNSLPEFLRLPFFEKPPFTRAMFLDGSKFREQLLKRVTHGTFQRNYFKIGTAVPKEDIFKELLKKFYFVTMAARFFDGIKICEQFLRGPPKEHSCQV